MLTITEENLGAAFVCALEGRLDGQTSSDATKRLSEARENAKATPIILDLEKLDYLSSAGLRVVLVTAKSAKAQGSQLVLCSPSSAVKEVLDISGFAAVLPIHSSRKDALQSFS